VASLSSSTGSDTGFAKDIRKMSSAELEAAAFADYSIGPLRRNPTMAWGIR
jgi:hypothetical protein